jgi:hypothetical protein
LFVLMFVDPHDTITHNYGYESKKYQPHVNYNLLYFCRQSWDCPWT